MTAKGTKQRAHFLLIATQVNWNAMNHKMGSQQNAYANVSKVSTYSLVVFGSFKCSFLRAFFLCYSAVFA